MALVYNMPGRFGSVKRCMVSQDKDSFRRNLNIHIVSEDKSERLVKSSTSLKENIKTWLNKNKMINDTIDILDAKVCNIGIEYGIVAEAESDRYDVISFCNAVIRNYFSEKMNIGEPLVLTDIYKLLNGVRGVIDAQDVRVESKAGALYSDVFLDIESHLSADRRILYVPRDHILEVKYPLDDIKGAIV